MRDFLCPWYWFLIDVNVIWNYVQKFVLSCFSFSSAVCGVLFSFRWARGLRFTWPLPGKWRLITGYNHGDHSWDKTLWRQLLPCQLWRQRRSLQVPVLAGRQLRTLWKSRKIMLKRWKSWEKNATVKELVLEERLTAAKRRMSVQNSVKSKSFQFTNTLLYHWNLRVIWFDYTYRLNNNSIFFSGGSTE